MRLKLATLSLALVVGCTPPPIAPPLQAAGINAGFDKTWNAVVDILAERNIPVKTMDRASGFVSAELATVSATRVDKLAELRQHVRADHDGKRNSKRSRPLQHPRAR